MLFFIEREMEEIFLNLKTENKNENLFKRAQKRRNENIKNIF